MILWRSVINILSTNEQLRGDTADTNKHNSSELRQHINTEIIEEKSRNVYVRPSVCPEVLGNLMMCAT